MSENKTPIRSLNGHLLADEQARADMPNVVLEMMTAAGLIDPVASSDGELYTDNNDKIYLI